MQFVGVVVILLTSFACNKQKILSDSELAVIFRDAFIANAYTTTNKLKLDSLRLYEPIFQKYGYTTADVQYTIGSFATRKSAKLGDVVEHAISMLEEQGTYLDYQVSILDTIDNIARRRTIHTLHEDSVLTMRTMKDTTKFVIVFDDLTPGEYEITFDYLIDSLDTTKGNYFSQSWINNRDEKVKDGDKPKQLRRKNMILTRKNVSKFKSSFNIIDSADIAVVTLAHPSKIEGKPNLTIKRLKITNPLSSARARDSLFKKILNVRIFDDELLFDKKETQNSI